MKMLRKTIQVLSASTLLAGLWGCAGEPVPDWQISTASATQQAVDAHLSGIDQVAKLEFARAQREARRSADPDVVARTVLMSCAAQVSTLDFMNCAEVPGLLDASPATQAYARYLMGKASPADIALLPAQQRKVASSEASERLQAVQAIDLAWSRLVAAGVLWRQGQPDLGVAQVAVDAASAQGWSRAVAVWLKAQQTLLLQAGRQAEADQVQRRLDLVLTSPAAAARPN